jgi:hypothetical protein
MIDAIGTDVVHDRIDNDAYKVETVSIAER